LSSGVVGVVMANHRWNLARAGLERKRTCQG
jgi:hypothetical protein